MYIVHVFAIYLPYMQWKHVPQAIDYHNNCKLAFKNNAKPNFEKQQRNVISVDALRELEFTLLTN